MTHGHQFFLDQTDKLICALRERVSQPGTRDLKQHLHRRPEGFHKSKEGRSFLGFVRGVGGQDGRSFRDCRKVGRKGLLNVLQFLFVCHGRQDLSSVTDETFNLAWSCLQKDASLKPLV